jgi:hypothetical protein
VQVNSVLGLLHNVNVHDIASILGVHAATIFRAEVCRLVSYCVYM